MAESDQTSRPDAPDTLSSHPIVTVSHALLVVVAAFLAAVVVAGFGQNVLLSLGLQRDSLVYRTALSALQFLGFGVGVGGYLSITDNWDLVDVRAPTLRDLGWILGGLVAILLAARGISYLLSMLGVQVAQNQVIEIGKQNPRYFLYMIPVSLLFVGPFEELVFRGGVQGLLRRSWGPRVAIPIASVLFGFAHWLALTGGGGKVAYVLIAATLALVLGTAYEYTENLVVPAVIHGGYNAALFLIQYAVATGTV